MKKLTWNIFFGDRIICPERNEGKYITCHFGSEALSYLKELNFIMEQNKRNETFLLFSFFQSQWKGQMEVLKNEQKCGLHSKDDLLVAEDPSWWKNAMKRLCLSLKLISQLTGAPCRDDASSHGVQNQSQVPNFPSQARHQGIQTLNKTFASQPFM